MIGLKWWIKRMGREERKSHRRTSEEENLPSADKTIIKTGFSMED